MQRQAVDIPLTRSAMFVQVAELLSRMALAGEVVGDGSSVQVSVPPTRSDVLHACDVAEVRRIASQVVNSNQTSKLWAVMICVSVPLTRSDVLHTCDSAEVHWIVMQYPT